MTADDLLAIAADLVRREAGRPRQASLKRAVSTAYYALFHALASECVSQTIGWHFRSADYWEIVTPIYRALDHGQARILCKRLANDVRIAPGLRTIAQAFVDLQAERIRADYDPRPTLDRGSSAQLIDLATRAIALLRALPDDQKRHLAVQLIAKNRPGS